MNRQVNFEDLPLRRFHIRTVFSGTGGQFSDGFLLGIIGIAVSMATVPLKLDAVWLGLLGAASLAGLFIGSVIAGPVADRFGRKLIFNYDMLIFAAVSGLQYFVTSPDQLLILRLLLGLVLGFDYVASKSLVTEFAPKRYRGRLLSILAAAWAGGYVVAYLAGFLMKDIGTDAWRLMLAISGLPALLILPFRMGIPESPIWLVARNRISEAEQIVKDKFGDNVSLPVFKTGASTAKKGAFSELFSKGWRKNTWVGCVFYTCQVIPFFALGTFSPEVLKALNVQDKFTGGLIYNALLMTGAIAGLMLIDKIPRRKFLVGTFYMSAVGLCVLAFADLGTTGTVMAFGFFACVLAAAVNLEFVYPPELFPTHLRASGIGVAVASSRFGSAFATFMLPIGVQNFGIHAALGFCVTVLLFGGIFCHLFAPETSNQDLAEIKST